MCKSEQVTLNHMFRFLGHSFNLNETNGEAIKSSEVLNERKQRNDNFSNE